MRRYLILTFALLLIVVIQVVPQMDLSDGDGGFTYAIVTRPHVHALNSTQSTRALPLDLSLATTPPKTFTRAMPATGELPAAPATLARVMRC